MELIYHFCPGCGAPFRWTKTTKINWPSRVAANGDTADVNFLCCDSWYPIRIADIPSIIRDAAPDKGEPKDERGVQCPNCQGDLRVGIRIVRCCNCSYYFLIKPCPGCGRYLCNGICKPDKVSPRKCTCDPGVTPGEVKEYDPNCPGCVARYKDMLKPAPNKGERCSGCGCLEGEQHYPDCTKPPKPDRIAEMIKAFDTIDKLATERLEANGCPMRAVPRDPRPDKGDMREIPPGYHVTPGDTLFVNNTVRVVKSLGEDNIELYQPCPKCGFHKMCICKESNPDRTAELDPESRSWDTGHPDRLAELREKYGGGDGSVGCRRENCEEVSYVVDLEYMNNAIAVINELLDMLEKAKRAEPSYPQLAKEIDDFEVEVKRLKKECTAAKMALADTLRERDKLKPNIGEVRRQSGVILQQCHDIQVLKDSLVERCIANSKLRDEIERLSTELAVRQ